MTFTSPSESATLSPMQFQMRDWAEEGDDVLVGREQGERARAALEAALRGRGSLEEPVALDFRGIRAVSVPFADGFFVPLLGGWLAGYYDEHPILMFGANRDVSETIGAVLLLRNLAVLSVDIRDEPSLLGGEPSLRETLKVAARLGSFSAAELARELGLSPQAANNRLKALVRIGALVRVPVAPKRGGREFEYRVPRTNAEAFSALE